MATIDKTNNKQKWDTDTDFLPFSDDQDYK